MVSAMRTDLHNLVTAQEAYFTNGSSTTTAGSQSVVAYNVSDERHRHAGERVPVGWGATATHAGPPAPARCTWAPRSGRAGSEPRVARMHAVSPALAG